MAASAVACVRIETAAALPQPAAAAARLAARVASAKAPRASVTFCRPLVISDWRAADVFPSNSWSKHTSAEVSMIAVTMTQGRPPDTPL